jgi:urease subunit alpha
VVTNVTLLDPVLGIRTASIGVRQGRVSGIGRAGNPNTLDGVDVVVGTGTTIIPGDGLIATPGAVDTHVHLLSPRVLEAALSSGVTTVIGQEIGPVWGVGLNSPWLLRRAFAAFDAWPVNIGFLARGSSSDAAPLVEGLTGGACGFKVHEDLGAHPRCLDTALTVAEDCDVQVALHTDGLNEAGCVSDTLAVADGRVFHAFHVEGCGGGHTPNVLELAGRPDVITSSTNPTLPFGRDALAEHLDMIALVHGLDPARAGDARLARDRVRAGTMAVEGPLHDLGVIPITSSDAQGMGRAGETIRRTFAMAAVMKATAGTAAPDDNERVLRYLAKLTINPAVAHGLADEVGSLEVGKLADVVLWEPAFFGAKPFLVLKAGVPAWGVTGDPNATIDTAEPLVLGPSVRRLRRHSRGDLGGVRGPGGDLGGYRAAWCTSPRAGAGHPPHRRGRDDPSRPPRRRPGRPRLRPHHPRRRAAVRPARRHGAAQPPLLPLADGVGGRGSDPGQGE